jgi:hypothetical protein
MENVTVKLGYSRLTPAALVEKGRNHVEKLTGNASFTLPVGFLPSLTAACDALEAANFQVLSNGGRTDTLLRKERVSDLKLLIKEAAGYVQAQCTDDIEKVNSAGFEVKRTPQPSDIPPAPLDVRVDPTTLPGQLKARWDGVNGRIYYVVWVTTGDPTLEEGWTLLVQTTKNFHLHTGLLSGKNYSYRVNAVSTVGAGPLSDYATAKAA